MSQGLHLSQRLSQQMVLSPQLQQSLALLQAPVLELKAMVEQELQQNPVLEEAPGLEPGSEDREERDPAATMADPAEPPADTRFDPATEKPSSEPVDHLDAEMQRLMHLDQEWRDFFGSAQRAGKASPEDEERRQFLMDSLTAGTSLQEELLDQVRNADLDDRQQQVAELLVGNIDDHGYLQSSIAELSFSTGIPAQELESALTAVQSFQPPGVGARDLRECLMLQLERIGRRESPEYRVLRDHMEALGKRRFPEIARHLGVNVVEAQAIAGRIAKLSPRPGRSFSSEPEQYVVPEVVVIRTSEAGSSPFSVNDLKNASALALKLKSSPDKVSAYLRGRFKKLSPSLLEDWETSKEPSDSLRSSLIGTLNGIIRDGSIWDMDRFDGIELRAGTRRLSEYNPAGFDLVRLNRLLIEDAYPSEFLKSESEYSVSTVNDHLPHLRISNLYKDLLSQAETSSEVREYVREKIKAGKFLIKSLHQRQSTILNIAQEIVKRQREFMDQGVSHLKPMTMLQVAEVVGVHETTVSRAVAGKYLSCPQGIFELKYFFTSGLATASGEQVSNKSVKTMLADMIASEDKAAPLSDEELVARLKAAGTMIARRTVAKYRSELNVLPSHLRRVY